MQPIRYEDFKVTFHTKLGDVYVVTVESPGGTGRAELHLDLNQFKERWVEVGEAVRGEITATIPIPLTPVEQVGDKLFNALFVEQVKDRWMHSLGQRFQQTLTREIGLRIKLEMDPNLPDMAQLMSLPWEFLYHKAERRFLNLDPTTPLVRYLQVAKPVMPYRFRPPLRILVVISCATANARRYAALNLAAERRRIEQAWANTADVEVDFLPQATLTALRPKLSEKDYHVLHFMGHGDFDLKEGRGMLLFEDDFGDPYPINGRDLADQLISKPSLQLVFLNACQTARISDAPGQDPFAGAAAALVMSGIPAVIAMQYPISDRAATTFAGTFYAQLAAGMPVDQATTEGRLAVRGAFRNSMEWGTPVLFMRTRQGELFEIEPSLPARPSPLSSALTGAIQASFRESTPAIAGLLPAPHKAEAGRRLDLLLQVVLRPDADGLRQLHDALAFFEPWPDARARVFELMQEPVLQYQVRQAGRDLARQYERLVFGLEA